MKAKIITGLTLFSLVSLFFNNPVNAKDKEPILMTVNGEEIPVSEFRYLYNKNLQQQYEPQTIDEYLEMFEIYRLKVADAKKEGKDTTSSFRKEIKQYKGELLLPYLADSVEIYKFIEIAAAREGEEVEANHIMMSKSRDFGENIITQQTLDSLRNELLKGADFEELARKYSQDKSVINNGGYIGYIGSGKFPYAFETAVFETPEGEISEIVESPMGYHIVKPGKRRASRGRVEVAHIMRLVPKDATPEMEERQKALADSIYYLVKSNPDRFGEIARKLSEDKASARQDGDLREFGSGEMVPEFEDAAFSLEIGEISKPVRSSYGWHIIKKRSEKKGRSYAEIKEDVIKRTTNPQDDRFSRLRKGIKERLSQKHNLSIDNKVLEEMKNISQGRLDSMIYTNWTQISKPIATVGKTSIPVSKIAKRLSRIKENRPEVSEKIIEETLNSEIMATLLAAEEEWQYENNEEYRNLLREYTDGSMLYEISVEKVWDKAAKDQEGLEKYFEKNKSNYQWNEPYAKGLLVQTVDETIAKEIQAASNGCNTDSVINLIKDRFQGKAMVEKFIVPQGVNAMIDNLMFGGAPVKPKNKNFTTYFVINGRLLYTPEEMSDVKGSVTSDYQDELEKEWVKELRANYPIKLNKKEFEKIKSEIARNQKK